MNFKIISFKTSHRNSVRLLIDFAFGKNYWKSKNLDDQEAIKIVAIHRDQVIGFATGEIVKVGNQATKQVTPIGILSMLIVSPEYQQKGIGTALFTARQQAFESKQVSHFRINHWKRKSTSFPIIAVDQGFVKKQSIPNFWKKISDKHDLSCPECGPPPCSCVCEVYVK